MGKWRVWRDEFWGDTWNDRREISSPEFEGTEFDDDKIEEHLLSYYQESVRDKVEIEGDGDTVTTRLGICGECDEVWPCKKHGELPDDEQPFTYIGYHAERVKQT